jgi:SAM-dependent methyltransferase
MMSELPLPLHQMQPLERFSERAQEYATYRPSYPVAAIDLILAGLGEPSHLVAADIGAGTGIASRLLAQRGVQVWAIEPNDAMRQMSEAVAQITWLKGSAEATGLETGCLDLVTCFQAFHWFDPDRCLPELHRILKPKGRLAVVWNNRDRADPFTQGYSEVVQRLSNQHPAQQRMVAIDPLFSSDRFWQVQEYSFPYRQALDLEGLIGRAESVSYIPKDAQTRQQLVTDLEALHQRWADAAGQVYLVYSTQVFLAQPGSP